MSKGTSFIGFGPYLKSFNSLEDYINLLKEQLTNIVTSLSHNFMESDLSTVWDQVPLQGVEVTLYL